MLVQKIMQLVCVKKLKQTISSTSDFYFSNILTNTTIKLSIAWFWIVDTKLSHDSAMCMELKGDMRSVGNNYTHNDTRSKLYIPGLVDLSRGIGTSSILTAKYVKLPTRFWLDCYQAEPVVSKSKISRRPGQRNQHEKNINQTCTMAC